LLQYPHIINCYLYNQDKLYAFKPAMVTQFAVNYAPQGGPAFRKSPDRKGGYPVEVEIQMVIKELEAWLKEDFFNPSISRPLYSYSN
jgi:hypothetical protein